jgi:branched-chain amino acid transport system permease protein
MKTKIFRGQELLAIVLTAFLALVMGRWSVIVIAATGGALIGLAQDRSANSWKRALWVGLVMSVVTAAMGWMHNNVLQLLPKQELIEESELSLLVQLGTLAIGTFTATALAFLRSLPNQRIGMIGQFVLLGAYLIAFPFFDAATGSVWMATIIVCMIYAMQAQGLNIVAGFSGMLDLGYVAFFAIGGYTVALLNSEFAGRHWPFMLIIWIAAAMAALFGLVLGAPVIPLRGDYLAIVTLGFGEIVPIAFKNLEAIKIYEPISEIVAWLRGVNIEETAICLLGCGDKPYNLTNGTQGISPIGSPGEAFVVGNYTPWYFLILAMVTISIFLIHQLRHSRLGRAMVAMSQDELAASAMGVPLTRIKLTAFMIGAMFSGFAGAFYGSYVSFISPDAFDFSISVIVLCMVILGGSGSIVGVLMGALVIKIIDLLVLDKLQVVINGVLHATVFQWNTNPGLNNFLESLLNMTQYKLLLFGLILVIMMITRPQGLVPASVAKYPEGK